MTAAGIALISGGLAILIGFRHLLWARSEHRAGARKLRAVNQRAALGARNERNMRGAGNERSALGAVNQRTALAPGNERPVLGAVNEREVVAAPNDHKASVARNEREVLGAPEGENEAAAPDVTPGTRPAGEDNAVEDERADAPVPGPRRFRRPPGGLARIGLADDDDEISGDVLGAEDESGEIDGPAEPWVAADGFGGGHAGAEEGAELTEAGEPRPEAPRQGQPRHAHPRHGEPTDGRPENRPADADAAAHQDGDEPGLRTLPARRSERYGDRIDGWVRPQYRDEPESGEYWTPVPESSYTDAGYGWPVPVERLPPVPAYPPQSGFEGPIDPAVPTALVPVWPPAEPSGRIELPRTWTPRNRKEQADDREPAPPRRRPRPRTDDPDRSTVYRSRHAADPG